MITPLELELWITRPRPWAKSIRWSCGRPSYRPTFDWAGAYQEAHTAELVRAFTEWGITVQPWQARVIAFTPLHIAQGRRR